MLVYSWHSAAAGACRQCRRHCFAVVQAVCPGHCPSGSPSGDLIPHLPGACLPLLTGGCLAGTRPRATGRGQHCMPGRGAAEGPCRLCNSRPYGSTPLCRQQRERAAAAVCHGGGAHGERDRRLGAARPRGGVGCQPGRRSRCPLGMGWGKESTAAWTACSGMLACRDAPRTPGPRQRQVMPRCTTLLRCHIAGAECSRPPPPAGLPRILVDLRHEATHNELPSLAALR